MSRRRVVLACMGALASLLVIALASIAWIATTEHGSRWAVDRARAYLPENIRFDTFSGVLAGPFRIEGLVVDSPGARVRVARVDLDWAPGRLLWSEVHVSRLDVRDVDVALQATGGSGRDEALALPDEVPVPFAVSVERLEVHDTRVQLPGGETHRLDRIALRFTGDTRGIAIEDFDITGPLLDADGDIRMGTADPFDVGGSIRWRVRAPDQRLAPLAGTLELGGSLRRTRLQLQTREPGKAALQVELRAFGQRPEWSGSLQLPRAALDAWWNEAPPWRLGAELQLAGSFEEVRVEGRTHLEGLPPGALSADVQLRASATGLAVEELRVSPEGRPGTSARLRGELDWSGSAPRFDLAADWEGIAWPLEGEPQVRDASGSMQAAGVPDDYRLEADASLRSSYTGEAPVRVRLRASGSTEALTGIDAGVRWRKAQLDGRGSLRWAPAGRTRLALRLRDLDPGALVDGLDGTIGATADLEAGWGDRVEFALNLSSVEGVLNGRRVKGSARLRQAGAETRIESMLLRAGDAKLEASGRLAETLEADWELAVPDLGQLVPQWGGRVEADGSISGTREQPALQVSARGSRVATPMLRVESLSANGRLAPLGGTSDLVIEAGSLATDAVTLDTLSLALRGTPEDHRVDAEAVGARGSAEVSVTGALQGQRWDGRILQAELAPTDLATWTLGQPAPVTVEGTRVVLERACWRSAEARFCGAFSGSAEDWQTRLDAERIPIGLVASLLRDDLQYRGTFGLDMRLSSSGGPVTGEARLDLQPGSVSGVIDEESETLLDFRASALTAVLTSDSVTIEGDLRLQDGGRVRVDGTVGRTAPHSLSGRVQARVADLGLVTVLSPAVGRMEGTLLADLELSGSVADPSMAGSARLDSGLMSIVPLGIELTDIEADLATATRGVEITVRAGSGEGRLRATTRIAREEDAWTGEGEISGEGFEAVDLPEATVVIAPDIEWRIAGRAVTVKGDVAVPSARIEPRDLSNTVQTSPDTVIVGDPAEGAAPEAAPLQVSADVAVTLGEDVHVDAFGLDGRLEGGIEVTERPDKVTRATGELRVIDGTYSIYAQTLQIERGRLLFDGGPAANPGLDVRAVRRPRDVLVGVNVRGRLREPEVTLFSEPPMQESEQLSYLLFGIPLNQTSEGQQSNLAVAAAALASSEEGSRIASRVGIQEVTVDNGAPGEGASLVLGRYLSPRLYVGYGIGLMEQANSVRIRYDLTRNWTVEARSGATSSADLLYSIEVDSSVDALNGIVDTDRGEDPSPPNPGNR